MSRATFTLFDDNRRIYQSALPEAGTNDLLAFSGLLDRKITVENVLTARTLWVCVGSREGEVTVVIDYAVDGIQTFLVTPGRPMVLETRPRAIDTINSISIAPSRGQATVEILVYPGEVSEPPIVPLDAILVLNAREGVEVTDGLVDSWEDIRDGGAAGLFLPLANKPTFIASHLPFGGQPSIFFGPGDTRLQSEDLASVFEFLGTGPFTMAMVCLARDDGTENQMASNESPGGGGGFGAGIDGGFRSFHRLTDDAGDANNENFSPNELRGTTIASLGTAIVYVIRYNGSRINVYRQGVELNFNDVGTSATSVAQQLIMGGNPSGGSLLDGAIADFRIWDYELEPEQRDGYVAAAVDLYGIFDEESAQAPLGAMYMLRANRGTTVVDDFVTLWGDTRPEITLDQMGLTPFLQTFPLLIPLDSTFNSHPSVNFGNDARQSGLAYLGDPEDFNLLLGTSDLFTVFLVYVSDDDATAIRGLMMGDFRLQPGSENLNTTINSPGTVLNTLLIGGMIQGPARVIMVHPENTNIPMDSATTRIRGGGASSEVTAEFTDVPTGVQDRGWILGNELTTLAHAGRLAEIRIYPRLLRVADRDQFMDYVADRYDVVDSPES